MRYLVIGAVALVCIGAVGLGIVESTEDDELRRKRQEGSNYKYAKSWLALCLPLAYCLLDAAGTFADSLVLRTLDEDSANCAYELTFLAAAVICFIYVVVIKKTSLFSKQKRPSMRVRCSRRRGSSRISTRWPTRRTLRSRLLSSRPTAPRPSSGAAFS